MTDTKSHLFANPSYSFDPHAPLAPRGAQPNDKVGMRVTPDGLTSRAGFRKVLGLPDTSEMLDVEHARELADRCLSGRDHTIFSRCVLDPADGLRGATQQQMAHQLGLSVSQVYRIIGKCQMKMTTALARERLKYGENVSAATPSLPWS